MEKAATLVRNAVFCEGAPALRFLRIAFRQLTECLQGHAQVTKSVSLCPKPKARLKMAATGEVSNAITKIVLIRLVVRSNTN